MDVQSAKVPRADAVDGVTAPFAAAGAPRPGEQSACASPGEQSACASPGEQSACASPGEQWSAGAATAREAVAFYYDLGQPECWLAAERISSTLPLVPEFVPVIGRRAVDDQPDIEALAARARQLQLLPLRWPSGWPPDIGLAARAATFAAQIGKVVAFSLAAFRQAFAAGRDLGDPNTVLIAAAACEMHPTAVLKAVRLRSTERALQRSCQRAQAAGVTQLPAITVGARVLAGEGCPELAAALLGAATLEQAW